MLAALVCHACGKKINHDPHTVPGGTNVYCSVKCWVDLNRKGE